VQTRPKETIMSADHDDFATEALPGLPELPPAGEDILWQGSPNTWALAREGYKITWVGGYFVALGLWQGVAAFGGNITGILAVLLPYLVAGALAVGILLLMAWVQARSTVYTITTARVAMRVGAALTVTLNLPFTQITSANMAKGAAGTGTLAFETAGDARISYLVLWPHVRPWHVNPAQPALRAIANPDAVASLFASAAEARINQPKLARTAQNSSAIAAQ
jgi:hypothetical protein